MAQARIGTVRLGMVGSASAWNAAGKGFPVAVIDEGRGAGARPEGGWRCCRLA